MSFSRSLCISFVMDIPVVRLRASCWRNGCCSKIYSRIVPPWNGNFGKVTISVSHLVVKNNSNLEMSSRWYPYLEYVVIGCSGITTILGTFFLLANHFSSGDTSRHTLITPGRNATARCCDALCLMLAYILQLMWTLSLCVHA